MCLYLALHYNYIKRYPKVNTYFIFCKAGINILAPKLKRPSKVKLNQRTCPPCAHFPTNPTSASQTTSSSLNYRAFNMSSPLEATLVHLKICRVRKIIVCLCLWILYIKNGGERILNGPSHIIL